MRIPLLLIASIVSQAEAADTALTLPTSAAPVAVAQAALDDVRLVVWELPNGAGLEAQALDASTHAALPALGRIRLGPQLPTGGTEPRFGSAQTRPAVAALRRASGEAAFLVAWHAEVLDENGDSLGTEIVGQRVFVNATGDDGTVDPLQRISRVDDDTTLTAASEARSAPVVVASESEDEFLVLWTHWPNGRTLQGDPFVSNDDYFIYGQEVGADGTLAGDASVRLDDQLAPPREGVTARPDRNTIFLAAARRPDGDGYLLAWSDPAQEDAGNRDQLYTKTLPASLEATPVSAREGVGQANTITEGTGRIALAHMPDGDGYLLAYEDMRGKLRLAGIVLDANGGVLSSLPIVLLDAIEGSTDRTFLSPQLVTVPAENRLLLYAAVGNHSVATVDVPLQEGRLVRRVLDPADLEFNRAGSDFETVEGSYPDVNIFFAAQAHAAGALPDGAGDVSFTVIPEVSAIAINEFAFGAEPPPPPAPPPPAPVPPSADDEGGGGAMFTLLLLPPLLRVRSTSGGKRCIVAAAGSLLLLSAASEASPADVELLHSGEPARACYRAVMYREVTAIHLGVSWGQAAFPLDMAIEIEDLPSGWKAEKTAAQNGKAQVVLLRPAPFDTATGFSIGKVCLRFARDVPSLDQVPYTYELAATGSRINAKARPDDGVSEDELRAMVKRGERLKNNADPLAKPKQVEETAKTVKRLKGLFD